MEALDQALARAANRVRVEPVNIRSLDDIRRAIAELDPNLEKPAPEVLLSTQVQAVEDGKVSTYQVSATTQSKSKRATILEGLAMLQRRLDVANKLQGESIEINGHEALPAKVGNAITNSVWVDPILKQWLGAYRDGLMICWDLGDGYIYRYDIFDHRLVRVAKDGS